MGLRDGPGGLAVLGSLLYWQALRVGKLSVVSPTVAMNAGLAAVLAVVLLGEELSTSQVVGWPRCGGRPGSCSPPPGGAGETTGVVWAVLSAIVLGFYTIGLALSVERVGVFWAALAYRVAGVVILGVIVAAQCARVRLDPTIRNAVVSAAILDTIGFVSLSYAFSIGSVAVVAVVARPVLDRRRGPRRDGVARAPPGAPVGRCGARARGDGGALGDPLTTRGRRRATVIASPLRAVAPSDVRYPITSAISSGCITRPAA